MGVLKIRRNGKSARALKGFSGLFSMGKASSSISSSSFSIPPSMAPSPLHHHNFSQSMMEENVERAEAMITKWDPEASSYTKLESLFQENRREAKEFIKCVKDLRRAMHFFVENSGSGKLVLAQKLMQIAMKRLESEFYRILTANRKYLDPESVSSHSSRMLARPQSPSSGEEDYGEETPVAANSISDMERLSDLAMADLKMIAECMISSGYGKECVTIYKIIRKSIVDEELYRLNVRRHSIPMINKMKPEVLEQLIRNWIETAKITTKTLFHGERLLCDHVFSASDTIRESCFSHATKEAAITLFSFPEIVAKSKRSQEKIFRLMDLYESVSDLWLEIGLIFSFESSSAVKLQALNSLHKMGDSIRAILSEFELSIQKNSSKTIVPGGGIHPLTNSVMNYISLLANYSGVLNDIIADSSKPGQSPLPEYLGSQNPEENPSTAISVRLAWTILVLLCKLDTKAELYNDIALSYLFLSNNLQFVIDKVQTTNLKLLLGDDWIDKYEKKMKQYAASYEAMAWTKVLSTLPQNSTDEMSREIVKSCFRQFNAAFEEARRKQASWLVPDGKLRDEIKVSIAKKLVPAYRGFYDTHMETLNRQGDLEALVRFAPDNLGNHLSDLFLGTVTSVSSSSPSSPASSHSRASWCLP